MEQPFIGTIARQTGVPIQTIRYYERLGLLPKPQRTTSGYRLYGDETGDRLQFIKKAQHLGLRLDEVKDILDLAERGRCPCGHVQAVLKNRLKELQQKIADLRLIEGRVKGAIRRTCPPYFKPKGKAICPTIQREGR